jgi:hypothetical protein
VTDVLRQQELLLVATLAQLDDSIDTFSVAGKWLSTHVPLTGIAKRVELNVAPAAQQL